MSHRRNVTLSRLFYFNLTVQNINFIIILYYYFFLQYIYNSRFGTRCLSTNSIRMMSEIWKDDGICPVWTWTSWMCFFSLLTKCHLNYKRRSKIIEENNTNITITVKQQFLRSFGNWFTYETQVYLIWHVSENILSHQQTIWETNLCMI